MLFREFQWRDMCSLADTSQHYKWPFWLEGGWGIDVLMGRPSRFHSDVDMIMETRYAEPWIKYLTDNGWELLLDENTRPWNLSYGREDKGLVFDIHVVDLDGEGNAHCGPDRVYPAEALRMSRTMDGNRYRRVRCLSPKWQVRFHTGYDVAEQDYQDLLLLHDKYRVKIPPEYDKFRELPAP